jgi:hypothetical protein
MTDTITMLACRKSVICAQHFGELGDNQMRSYKFLGDKNGPKTESSA